jgi:hypothetical protein
LSPSKVVATANPSDSFLRAGLVGRYDRDRFPSAESETYGAANTPEMPSNLVELTLPCKTTKMQSELLSRGESAIPGYEYPLPVAIDRCSILNIHKNGYDPWR